MSTTYYIIRVGKTRYLGTDGNTDRLADAMCFETLEEAEEVLQRRRLNGAPVARVSMTIEDVR